MTEKNPFQPTDETARLVVQDMLHTATHAALAVVQPETGWPSVTRVALAMDAGNVPISLVSSMATHTQALEHRPDCALLIGDPGDKGDPLTHPRMTLHCRARLIARDSAEHIEIREVFLSQRPKSKLYIDFPDFRFVKFNVIDGLLNRGFGKAHKLTGSDVQSASPIPPDANGSG